MGAEIEQMKVCFKEACCPDAPGSSMTSGGAVTDYSFNDFRQINTYAVVKIQALVRMFLKRKKYLVRRDELRLE